MSSSQTTPVVFNMDVEPDERVVKKVSDTWPGFVKAADFLTKARPRLEDATGRPVHFNWLLRMDPQIEGAHGELNWCVNAHRAIFEELKEAGDCFGLHIHTWRKTKKMFRTTWMAEYQDVEWIQQCMHLAHETFVKEFGYKPTVYSMGDNFMRTEIMETLEKLGARIDVTMASGINFDAKLVRSEVTSGRLPDYRKTPSKPFKPSRTTVTEPGEDAFDVWEAPVSCGLIGQNRDGSDKVAKLLMGTHPDRISAIIDQNLDMESPFLVAESRSDVRTHPKTKERFDWCVEHFIEIAKTRNLELMTHDNFVDRLDSGQLKTVH